MPLYCAFRNIYPWYELHYIPGMGIKVFASSIFGSNMMVGNKYICSVSKCVGVHVPVTYEVSVAS